jgi:hypothetical protein
MVGSDRHTRLKAADVWPHLVEFFGTPTAAKLRKLGLVHSVTKHNSPELPEWVREVDFSYVITVGGKRQRTRMADVLKHLAQLEGAAPGGAGR